MHQQIKYITQFPETENEYGEEWYNHNQHSFLVINCSSSNIYYPEHWTPLSVKCVFSGKEYYKFKNITYAVTRNNFLLLNEGSIYSSFIHSDAVTESFTLNFSRKNIESLSSFAFNNEAQLVNDPFKKSFFDLRVFEKLYNHNPRTLSYIHAIKNFKAATAAGQHLVLEYLYNFLEELVSLNSIVSCEIDNIAAKKRSTREELYKRLHIARDYIQSCYHKNITLDHLSAICYLNPFHLLRAFKSYFKITPHKYLMNVRLNEAEKLIRQKHLSITDIVSLVGFEDLSSFSRLFKKYYNTSPQAYRNKNIL